MKLENFYLIIMPDISNPFKTSNEALKLLEKRIFPKNQITKNANAIICVSFPAKTISVCFIITIILKLTIDY